MGLILILLALIERLVFDLGPNIELVTMASVLAGLYISGKKKILVPLVIMGISDVFLGFSLISIFTWSGFVLMSILPKYMNKYFKTMFGRGLGTAMVGNIVFYLWTNFGVWLTDKWGMYTNDLLGLIHSYVMGLPFLKIQILSSLIFVPLFINFYEIYLYWKRDKNRVLKTSMR